MEMREQKHTNDVKLPEKKLNMADPIQNLIGAFGRYQLWMCVLIFMSKFPIAFHQMAILFLAPSVKFTCNEAVGECPCSDPVYDTSVFTRTITMEWNLICGSSWLASFNQTLFQLGTLIGSLLFGMASDRFGRKLPFCAAVTIQVVGGVAAAFMPNYWLFTFVRFLIGMSVGGTMVIGFVIVMEFVGSKYRDVVSALYQVPFNLGHLTMTGLAYFFRDYAHFQLSISIPTVLMFSYFCLVPETPRWLIAMKKTDKAVKILTLAAKTNKMPTENVESEVVAYQALMEKHALKKGTIVDLFRTPNLRRNICVMAFNWLSCSYCFYGLSQYVGQLSGNIFINVSISAGVTLCGTLLSIPLIRVFGRKTILIVFNVVCGVCLLVMIFVPAGMATVCLASTGVVSAFIVFVLVYLYASELFPTVVRNAAMGLCSMMARVGSMIAPFVVDTKQLAVWAPPVLFGIVPLIASIPAFWLPETRGCELMTTIEEGENFTGSGRNPNTVTVDPPPPPSSPPPPSPPTK